ncbi:hypothetical protein LCGC14_1689660 [marine sediment metagenome]|uniref:Uncharacterized protein n=1 Tax=marine sediment metagenome TaxID=412755 RepID=A0A0F9KLC6_9ZZZZ
MNWTYFYLCRALDFLAVVFVQEDFTTLPVQVREDIIGAYGELTQIRDSINRSENPPGSAGLPTPP